MFDPHPVPLVRHHDRQLPPEARLPSLLVGPKGTIPVWPETTPLLPDAQLELLAFPAEAPTHPDRAALVQQARTLLALRQRGWRTVGRDHAPGLPLRPPLDVLTPEDLPAELVAAWSPTGNVLDRLARQPDDLPTIPTTV